MSLLLVLLRLLVSSRRCLAAWTVYAALLAAVYASDAGPPLPAYASTAGALCAVALWIVLTGFVTDRSTTSLLAAAAGGAARLHGLQAAAGLVASLPLVALAVGWGWAAGPHPAASRTLAVGLLAHLAAVLVGGGVGALASPPVLRDRALCLAVAVGALVLAFTVPPATPLGPLLRGLNARSAGLADAAAWGLAAAGWGLVLTCAGAVVAHRRNSYGTGAPS
ncbi:hypothetical protein G9H71_04910 [Motilibacter sp. E257]|uniref:ABC-2 type transport system permease protein n=1 Tax=Motilibacter deserti TaxID=2714956 RepID=A0ABX0GRK9_9ACTN|nr:hypothetical protein [Motilibacter deserti]